MDIVYLPVAVAEAYSGSVKIRYGTGISDWVWIKDDIELKTAEQIMAEMSYHNKVDLCESCSIGFEKCGVNLNHIVFGDGEDDFNVCSCYKYKPISVRGER